MSSLIPFPTELPPRITRMTLNMEIEHLLRENVGDEELNRLLASTDDETAVTAKFHGDRWLVAARLNKLANGGPYPAVHKATIADIRTRLYGVILPRIGQDRKTRIAADLAAKRVAAAEAAKEESLDHSGE